MHGTYSTEYDKIQILSYLWICIDKPPVEE